MGTKESIDDAEKIEKEILMSLEGKIIPFEKIQNMDEKDIIFYILDLTKTAENSKKNNRNSFISIHSVVAAAIFADSHPLHDICPVNAYSRLATAFAKTAILMDLFSSIGVAVEGIDDEYLSFSYQDEVRKAIKGD